MKVYLRTFGCRANQYDSETVRAMLAAAGEELVASPDEADVAIFNSCAVTSEAEADLRQGIRRAARANPSLRTVVTGCAAALDKGSLRALPTVAEVIGETDAAAIGALLGARVPAGFVAAGQRGARGLLRIQDGCDEHCTFCATTIARGANRSRPIDHLVDEATRLAEHHAEVVLTGVHIGSYGLDAGASLAALVERLVRAVPSVRFRLTSIEATEVDAHLRELFAEPAHLVPHLHAPLQSGSDRVLRRMGRHWYTADAYARAVDELVAGRSAFGVGADVIAGFPGETEDDHRRTVELIRALPFTYLHVFPWSERPGTAAARLGGRVPAAVAARRARELRELAAAKAQAHRARRAGGDADVVVVGPAGRRSGMTEDYLEVDVAGGGVRRGMRLRARLDGDAAQLIATPH